MNTPLSWIKDYVPDLGCFIQSICISSYSWDDLKDVIIEEFFDRSVLHQSSDYSKKKESTLNPSSDNESLRIHFEGMRTGLRLILFDVTFLTHFGKPVGRTVEDIKNLYDGNNGIIPQEMSDHLLETIHKINSIQDFSDFYHLLGMKCPEPFNMITILLTAIERGHW